jgi:PAS domain S-box-containing protein
MENDLSRVVDALPGLIWTALPDGRADFLNRRWLEYTGMSSEDAYGWGWHSALHPDDRHPFLSRWSDMLASGTGGECEARLRRFDGDYRWFVFGTRPISDADGKIVKWCGVNTDIEDRRRAEAHLRARELPFQRVVDGLPAIVTFMKPDGEIDSGNRHMMEYFGESIDAIRSQPVGNKFHPDDRPEVLRRWQHSIDTGEPYNYEARILRADGVYRWFQTLGFPLRDDDGTIFIWYLLQTDVHDRRRAEDVLAGEKRVLEAAESLPAVLDAFCGLVEDFSDGARCSVAILDRGGTCVEHATAPNLPSTFVQADIDNPIATQATPNAVAASRNETFVSFDLAIEPLDTGLRTAAATHGIRACCSTPFLSKAGDVLGAFTIYFDALRPLSASDRRIIDRFAHLAGVAVERVLRRAQLRRSEAFLREAQSLSRTGSWSWNTVTGERTWSEQAYRIFEIPHGETVTYDLILSRVHPEDVGTIYEITARGEAGDQSELEHEYRLLLPDGSIKWLRGIAHATTNGLGQREYIGAFSDVTHVRRSEDALSKVRSELAHVARVTSLGALTASIAHEVNQPLAGIITNAGTCLRMLAADPPNVRGARETARRTIRDGNRAADVIARLRALFAKQGTTSEAVDLHEATREVIALSRNELQRNAVVLRLDFATDLPPVSGDRVQLQQVILNLLMNASDAMSDVNDRPRHLTIKTERAADGFVRLSVHDAGAGFGPHGADKLFDAFYTTKPSGMGIGLSVSRSIIESHGGELVAKANTGPGSTFAFSLPCQAAAHAPRDTSRLVSNS